MDKKKIKELKEIVNPSKLIKENKLDIVPEATKIFIDLQSNSLTSKQLIEIESKIEKIFNYHEEV